MKIEKEDSFINLGIFITTEGSIAEEIRGRIVKSDKCAGGLIRFFK